jgi:hypothetical protein
MLRSSFFLRGISHEKGEETLSLGDRQEEEKKIIEKKKIEA